MDISGTRNLAASRQAVWDALHNPTVLHDSIPGAEEVTWQGNSALTIRANIGVGPLKIAGTGQLQVVEQTPPSHLKMALKKQGAASTVQADVTIDLAEAGSGTQVTYHATAKLDGPVAIADNPLTRPVVDGLLGQFFNRLEQQLH
jgi:carbon monoxide dehydrogenase subunit G